MGSFQRGLDFGKSLYMDAEQSRRQDAYDKQRQNEADYLQEQRMLQRGIRSDNAYNAQRGLTGITPNMTTAPGGVGPVASPEDVDWKYNPQNPGAVPYAPPAPQGTGSADSGAYPPINVASASGGLPDVMFNGVPANTAPPLPPAEDITVAGKMPGIAPARASRIPAIGKPGKAAAGGVTLPAANDGGMTEEQQTGRIAASQLKAGDYQGFYGSQDRAKAQKLDADHTAYMKSLIEMPADEFGPYLKKHVTDNPKLKTKVMAYDPKTERISLKDDDGTEHEMTRTQGMIFLSGAWLAGHGKVDAGLEKMAASTEQFRAQQREGQIDSERQLGVVANQNLNVTSEERKSRHEDLLLKIEARKAAAAEKAARDHWAPTQYANEKGEPLLYNASTGETKTLAGVRALRDPASDIATRAEIQKRAQYYLDGNVMNESGPNKGKKVNAEEALARAEADFPNAPTGRRAPGIDVSHAASFLPPPPGAKPAPAGVDMGNPDYGVPAPAGGVNLSRAPVPQPPPKVIEQGGRRINNPAFQDWLRTYGDTYDAQQGAAAREAAMGGFRTQPRRTP